jgi:HEAT repeat protein
MLACECLGALGHVPAAGLIEKLIDDPEPSVRGAAVNALMRLGCDGAIPAMGKCLVDAEAIVREATVAAFCCMDVEIVAGTVLALVEAPTFPRRIALTVARANPHRSYHTFIIACLSDAAPAVRRAAVEALARQPTVDVVGTLEPLLHDADADVRRAVVGILGGFRSRRVKQLLTNQAETDAETVVDAVQALGKLGEATVVPFLVSLYDREETPAKLAIVDVLKEIRDPATEPFLARQLGNPDPALRRAVVLALGAIRSENAVRQLVPVAKDPDDAVRSAVVTVLGTSDSAPAIDALTRLAHDPSRPIAALARQALEKLGQPLS